MSNVADKLRDLARDNTQFSDKLRDLAQEIENGDLYGEKTFPEGQKFEFKLDSSDNSVHIRGKGGWFFKENLRKFADHISKILDDLEHRDANF